VYLLAIVILASTKKCALLLTFQMRGGNRLGCGPPSCAVKRAPTTRQGDKIRLTHDGDLVAVIRHVSEIHHHRNPAFQTVPAHIGREVSVPARRTRAVPSKR